MEYTPEETRTRRLQHEERKNRPLLMSQKELIELTARMWRDEWIPVTWWYDLKKIYERAT